MTTPATFDELCSTATASDGRFAVKPFEPYGYQRRIAADGFPELLEIPTGCGKTLAVILAWIWRRRFHPDLAVRCSTPRRLVYVLPQRVLVEQVAREVDLILSALGLADDVATAVLMGGEAKTVGDWRLRPEGDAILVATQDMALSAALNRRYGESRWTWPIEFGLVNNDTHFVYDEIQLMGPGLPTSRQLDGLRRALGTAVASSSTWMSATVDEALLATVDNPSVSSRIGLTDSDRAGHLATRLNATRAIAQVAVGDKKSYIKDLATALIEAHRPGKRTIAVVNTVGRAVELYKTVKKANDQNAEVVLVHSRFRPADRRSHLDRALQEPSPEGSGTIVVTTQVLEAGVDVTSDVLFTEAAPWSSIVQRAGRCNRDGAAGHAVLMWSAPPSSAPYDDADVTATSSTLESLEGTACSTEWMAQHPPEAAGEPAVHQVLRRRDLLELFDTLPDLSGSDIDISRFIRDADDRDVTVAWVDFAAPRPPDDLPLPTAEARCSVPISDTKALIALDPWRFDHLRVNAGTTKDGGWVRCANPRELRPGMVLVLDAKSGGYDSEIGWAPKAKDPVAPVAAVPADDIAHTGNEDTGVGDDPLSVERRDWVSLVQHLADVEVEAAAIDAAITPPGLSADQRRAAVVAARLHDLGKAHPVFQETLEKSAASDDESARAATCGPPWAKSGGSKQSHHARRYFRHELASALALLDDGHVALDGEAEQDLIVYLVAAHHGRVRLGFRSLPGEFEPEGALAGQPVALGIIDGESLPAVELPAGTLPPSMLDLSVMRLGRGADGRPSWAQRMLPLRDRADLGPFRLGFLEALVRMADWRASASPGGSTTSNDPKEPK